MQDLKGKTYDQLASYLHELKATCKFIEQTSAQRRTPAQRDTLKEFRASIIQVRRAMQNHPDKPRQLELFPYPLQ